MHRASLPDQLGWWPHCLVSLANSWLGLPVPDPHSSRMSMSDQPSGSTDRKRKFHNFASSLHHGSDLTSKRPTPSSSPFLAASAPSAPSSLPGRSESTYIDLTGYGTTTNL